MSVRAFSALSGHLRLELPSLLRSRSTRRRRYRPLSRAPFWLALVLLFSASLLQPLFGQSFDGRDPATGKLLAPGAAIGQYLQASEELKLRILTLRKALDQCGNCTNRTALQRDIDQAIERRNTIRAGEGIALRQLGLPGKNFEEFVYQMRTGYNWNNVAAVKFAEQLRLTILNYCMISTKDDGDNLKCRTKYFDNSISSNAANSVEICFKRLQAADQELLHNFPPPDADPKLVAAHAALWIANGACLKEMNAYELMRNATNEACGFQDLGASLNEPEFICACKAFPADRKAACPANPVLPQPAFPTFPVLVEPAVRMLDPQGYGPELLGVRLGQPVREADQLIRRKMAVESVYDLPTANHKFLGTDSSFRNRDGLWQVEFGGRLYVNRDGSEFVAIMTVPNLPGRVFELMHSVLVSPDKLQDAQNALVAEQGPPSFSTENILHHNIWGSSRDQRECAPAFAGLALEEWVRLEGQPTIVSKKSAGLGTSEGRQFGLYGMLSPLMATYVFNRQDGKLYNCQPTLAASYELASLRQNDPQGRLRNEPALVNERLFDTALFRWYEIQQEYKNSKRSRPIAYQ